MWTIWPSLHTLWLVRRFEHSVLYQKVSQHQFSTKKLKEKIHLFFLERGQYIPLEDIIFQKDKTLLKHAYQNLSRVCHEGGLFIWIPLFIQFPFFTPLVSEHCFVFFENKTNFSSHQEG